MKKFEERINEITYIYEQQNEKLFKEFYHALKLLQKKTSVNLSTEVHIIEDIFLRKTNIVEFAYKAGMKDACKILNEISTELEKEIGSETG